MPIKPGVMYELAPDGRVMLEMQDVMDMVADVRRLEWFAKGDKTITKIEGKFFVEWEYHWEYTRSTEGHKDWRAAIDEAMRERD